MSSADTETFDVVVIGAGPAGAFAAIRAGNLGARTALVTGGTLGGMAANDGPVPVRALAHAARLVREAHQLGRYGISGCEPVLDYARLLARVDEVVMEAGQRSMLRSELGDAGVTILENAPAAFESAGSIAIADGRSLRFGRSIICTGGTSRRLSIPGFELTATHSDAWSLQSVPESMLIVGGGATGMQVASVFNAFGTRIDLFEAHDRILKTEDVDVAAVVEAGFRARRIRIHTAFGSIDRFEPVAGGIAMHYSRDGQMLSEEAALAVTALGWVARTEALNLAAAGIATDARGFVQVDEHLRTTAPNVYAAGDVTGRMMLAPQAIQQGFVAATNALSDKGIAIPADQVAPMGSFTDPEYAQVGLTEEKARGNHRVETIKVPFDMTTRPIIDGRTEGLCKLVADRETGRILGCHIVGERAVDVVQVAATAIAARMTVLEFMRIPLAFPTYAGVLGRATAMLAQRLYSRTEFDLLQQEF